MSEEKAPEKTGGHVPASSPKGKTASFASFFEGVRREFGKIVWPKREDIVKQATAVVAVTLFLGLLIALLDGLFSRGMDYLMTSFDSSAISSSQSGGEGSLLVEEESTETGEDQAGQEDTAGADGSETAETEAAETEATTAGSGN